MATVGFSTLDHTGFMTQGLIRAERFYDRFFGAEILQRGALTTPERRIGYPPLTFINMGGHRYELFLADEELPQNADLSNLPLISFEVSPSELDRARWALEFEKVPFEENVSCPALAAFIDRSINFLDPDQNVLQLCHRIRDGGKTGEGHFAEPIHLGRISHVILESTDLDKDTAFYVEGMGMRLLSQNASEAVFQALKGQLLMLQKVDRLSPRSLFRSGKKDWPSPDFVWPDQATRRVNKGAHTAFAVASDDIFREIQSRIARYGGFDEGDHRAALRATGELSTYYYDPSGNRLQLIVIPE